MERRSAAEAEKEELIFLVGNACGRVTNLLIAADRDEAALKAELDFLAEKAGRLSALLQGPEAERDRSGGE